MLVTPQPAGAAPLPGQSPCVFCPFAEPAYTLESPNPVQRKIFMSWIVDSIETAASFGTPNDWETIDTIGWAILS